MDYLSLCLICKDENDYIHEWLDYHILLGADRFYIYDNESQVSLRETLKDYIERGWVVVVNIKGKAMQLYAYDHCLQTFGPYTRWLGFIDVDEFLVPKNNLYLKELLKDYEAYAGLAVSSLFFGSNGHKNRPSTGQISAYTRRTHDTFKQNELVKSIVQPGLVQMPNSPHDFTYKDSTWCVNESFLRVDGQHFANHTDNIQLNHYFCRSESEIDMKLRRGNSGDIPWPRRRFDVVNMLSTYDDTSIFRTLDAIFRENESDSINENSHLGEGLLARMAFLVRRHAPIPLEIIPPREVGSVRDEFREWMEIKNRGRLADERGDYKQVCESIKDLIKLQPSYPKLYIDLCINYLHLGDTETSWLAISRAWQLAPNTYAVLIGMTLYFSRMKNYAMVERTCHLILEISPHNLRILGHLTEALIGQNRYGEALNVGVPVVELSARVGELPEGMGVWLVKKMADYLLEQKDYAGAARLWEAGVGCQPGDINALLELCQTLLLNGDKKRARKCLAQAMAIAPQNEAVLTLSKQIGMSESVQKSSH